MSKVEEGKFVRMFGKSEIRLTACAVSRDFVSFVNYFCEPNQFWSRDPKHERALVKYYKREVHGHSMCFGPTQIIKIPMLFPGANSNDGWGELQFLIKAPRLVRLARHRSFDTRVNQWIEETKPIQPKADFGNHSYLSLRFYHQDHLPPTPSNWYFEPVYVSVMNLNCVMFYRIDVWWENEEIKIGVFSLDKDYTDIPKHLK